MEEHVVEFRLDQYFFRFELMTDEELIDEAVAPQEGIFHLSLALLGFG